MAGGSLLALLDKIAVVLDDVALMTKVAAKKTAGVLGDDLALNAQQVSGVRAERELPVVFAVFKGSAINKLILVPLALMASSFFPWLITPMLMIGGAYLCFEGAEKIVHSFSKKHSSVTSSQADKVNLADNVDLKQMEQEKIKGAIKTDFVLSAEIIVIALGTVQGASFYHQLFVVSAIAVLMTFGVYGLVAAIVKLDDVGLYLLQTRSVNLWGKLQKIIGQGLLNFAPLLMRTLAVVGTIAMFLVGGSILFHNNAVIHLLILNVENMITSLVSIGNYLVFFVPSFSYIILGFMAGIVVLLLVNVIGVIKQAFNRKAR